MIRIKRIKLRLQNDFVSRRLLLLLLRKRRRRSENPASINRHIRQDPHVPIRVNHRRRLKKTRPAHGNIHERKSLIRSHESIITEIQILQRVIEMSIHQFIRFPASIELCSASTIFRSRKKRAFDVIQRFYGVDPRFRCG
ncbi:hypothetical protein EUTSA_v10010810mg [Eutrema salsugineum]|uniref:Uncharacterized protein n=1 Tax=Eutrema salsugineum TaxID=72664 RepID=V4LPA8_EUTSA|nr:hypothetical protein EUTSA_v10010810mg [Eutrema salsugineum]